MPVPPSTITVANNEWVAGTMKGDGVTVALGTVCCADRVHCPPPLKTSAKAPKKRKNRLCFIAFTDTFRAPFNYESNCFECRKV